MINLPTPYAVARITAFLSEHLCWSAFWDKRDGVWRVSENDPDSDLYAASRDAEHGPCLHGRSFLRSPAADDDGTAEPR